MKQLIWKVILPATLISFSIFTKWWYVLPEDAPDNMMSGLPFIWISDGWHTSGSFQIFVAELCINLSIYFLFWTNLIYSINPFLVEIKLPKVITGFLWVISGIIIVGQYG